MSVSTVTVTTFSPIAAAAYVLQIIVFFGRIYTGTAAFPTPETSATANSYVLQNGESDFKKEVGLIFV